MKTFYHYSDSGLVAEMDSNGNTLKSYGYRPGSPWGTDPLFMRENGKNYWYLNDHLGTPQMIVAENGGVVWKAQYQVFGKAEISNDSTVTNNLRFPGQYHDEETGLYYNWNRYYDPESGRYSQTDPIGFEGGDVNLYQYSRSNSIIFTDNDGLLTDDEKTYVRNCIEGRPCPNIPFDFHYPPKDFKDRMFHSITRCNSREEYDEKNKNFREFMIPEIRRGLCFVKCTVSASVGFSVEDISKNVLEQIGDMAIKEAEKSNIKTSTVRFGRGSLHILKVYLRTETAINFIECSVDCCKGYK